MALLWNHNGNHDGKKKVLTATWGVFFAFPHWKIPPDSPIKGWASSMKHIPPTKTILPLIPSRQIYFNFYFWFITGTSFCLLWQCRLPKLLSTDKLQSLICSNYSNREKCQIQISLYEILPTCFSEKRRFSESDSCCRVWTICVSAPTWGWHHHNGNTHKRTHRRRQVGGSYHLAHWPWTAADGWYRPPKEATAEEF